MTHVTCRLTAKNRDRLRNPTLSSLAWATSDGSVRCLPASAVAGDLNYDMIRYDKLIVVHSRADLTPASAIYRTLPAITTDKAVDSITPRHGVAPR